LAGVATSIIACAGSGVFYCSGGAASMGGRCRVGGARRGEEGETRGCGAAAVWWRRWEAVCASCEGSDGCEGRAQCSVSVGGGGQHGWDVIAGGDGKRATLNRRSKGTTTGQGGWAAAAPGCCALLYVESGLVSGKEEYQHGSGCRAVESSVFTTVWPHSTSSPEHSPTTRRRWAKK